MVAEVMNREVKTVSSEASVKEAAELMNEYRIGSLIVVENQEVAGIITERDILVKVVAEGKDPSKVKVSEIMTKNFVSVRPDESVEDAAELMTRYGIKKLPVIESGVLVGILTASDIVASERKLLEKLSELFVVPKRTRTAI